jgi:hypothetical protein
MRRQRLHQSLIRPASILGMPQKAALFVLAVLGAQFVAGGVRPLSLAFLAFDLAVLYPLLAWLGKTDVRGLDVFAESLSYRGFYVARSELRRRQGQRPLSAAGK